MKEIELFQKSGFTLYESKILLSLSRLDRATAKQLEKDSSVPKNKVYETLEKLSNEGTIQVYFEKPKQYGVINIKEVINSKLDEKRKQLDNLCQETEKLSIQKKNNSYFEEKFWVMEGENAMINKIIETLEETKKESIGFVDVWAAKYSNLKSVKKGIEKGIKFYFLGKIDKTSYPIAKKFADLGVYVKHHNITDSGYSIFDSSKVQLRVSDEKLLSLWIESESFAQIMREHFFSLWNQAQEIDFSKKEF